MVARCSVSTCMNVAGSEKAFFCSNAKHRDSDAWKRIIKDGRDELPDRLTVCQDHFADEDFINPRNKSQGLRSYVLPRLNLPSREPFLPPDTSKVIDETLCLTCTKHIESESVMSISDQQHIKAALAKHFWFEEHESTPGVICRSCWSKIDDFHQFYCEIERLHSHKQLYVPDITPDPLRVKTEPLDSSHEDPMTMVEVDIKVGHGDPDADEKTQASEDGYNFESAADRYYQSNEYEDDDSSYRDYYQNYMGTTIQNTDEGNIMQQNIKQEEIHITDETSTFQCSVCPKTYPTKKHLMQHERYHRSLDNKRWQCQICQQYFAYESILRAHTLRVHSSDGMAELPNSTAVPSDLGNRPAKVTKKSFIANKLISEHVNLECDTCAMKFDDFQALQVHSEAEHQKAAFVLCCDQKFNRKCRLMEHIRLHLSPDSFKCDVCGKQYRQLRALKDHKERAHAAETDRILKCFMCPKTFTQQKHLNIHEKYHRKLSEKKWHCNICDRYYAYESALVEHNRANHFKEYRFICHICAREFTVRATYRAHMASHGKHSEDDKSTAEKIPCNVCGKQVGKHCMRVHMLRHTEAKTCDQCGREYKNEMALRNHVALHRKSDLICFICGKMFKLQQSLKEHLATHTGEALYSCNFCDRKFNSHANHSSHRKKMHPKEWLEEKMRQEINQQQDLTRNQAMQSSV